MAFRFNIFFRTFRANRFLLGIQLGSGFCETFSKTLVFKIFMGYRKRRAVT